MRSNKLKKERREKEREREREREREVQRDVLSERGNKSPTALYTRREKYIYRAKVVAPSSESRNVWLLPRARVQRV